MGYRNLFSGTRGRVGLRVLVVTAVAALLIGSISFVLAQPPGAGAPGPYGGAYMPPIPGGGAPGGGPPTGMNLPQIPTGGPPPGASMMPTGAAGMPTMPTAPGMPTMPTAPTMPGGGFAAAPGAAGRGIAALLGVTPDWNAAQWALYLSLAAREGKIRDLYQNELQWHADLAQLHWNAMPRWEQRPMSGWSPAVWWGTYVGTR